MANYPEIKTEEVKNKKDESKISIKCVQLVNKERKNERNDGHNEEKYAYYASSSSRKSMLENVYLIKSRELCIQKSLLHL